MTRDEEIKVEKEMNFAEGVCTVVGFLLGLIIGGGFVFIAALPNHESVTGTVIATYESEGTTMLVVQKGAHDEPVTIPVPAGTEIRPGSKSYLSQEPVQTTVGTMKKWVLVTPTPSDIKIAPRTEKPTP